MDCRSLFLISLLYTAVTLGPSTFLSNLRRYRIVGAVGRFSVPRYKLEEILRNRKSEDSQCGNFVSLSLPKSLPSENYDESLFGELTISFATIEEKNIDYLPCEVKEKLETSHRNLIVVVPYVSNGRHGVLTLVDMTDVPNRLTPPYMTNDQYRVDVDKIDEDGENVTLSIGNDTMTLNIFKNTSCHSDVDVGNDFDTVHGPNVTFTSYPKPFDWNCGSLLKWDTGYCRVLRDNLCEIQRFDGDVCIHDSERRSARCPSSISITSANGVFGDILSGMFDTFPVDSFEAEWIDRVVDVGIEYPCLSK